MKNKISLEYAEALFTLAMEESAAEEYLADVRIVRDIFEGERELLDLLRSPNLTREEKESVIDSVFGGALKEHTVSLLKLLSERGRAELIPLCLNDFERLYNEVNKVVLAEVTSAVELTDEEKARLKGSLEKKTGHRVELVCRVDKDILGGIIVRTDDLVLDGSLKHEIRRVKDVIKSEPKT